MSNDLSMSKEEQRAASALLDGDVAPLAAVLGNADGYLHPIIQNYLKRLIDGSETETDFRLTTVRHPNLKRVDQGVQHQLQRQTDRLAIALKVYDAGVMKPGQYDSAIYAVSSALGKSLTTVSDCWMEFKGDIEKMKRRDIID